MGKKERGRNEQNGEGRTGTEEEAKRGVAKREWEGGLDFSSVLEHWMYVGLGVIPDTTEEWTQGSLSPNKVSSFLSPCPSSTGKVSFHVETICKCPAWHSGNDCHFPNHNIFLSYHLHKCLPGNSFLCMSLACLWGSLNCVSLQGTFLYPQDQIWFPV